MRDEVDPPRKHYQFRPTSFERVNSPSAQSAVGAVNRTPPPIDASSLVREANSELPKSDKIFPVNHPNEVQQMLRENLERANAAGINNVDTSPRRRSRRARDYWLILVVLNGFFASVAFGPYRNPMTLTYGVAGIIVTTVGLTWVMWFVMDDY